MNRLPHILLLLLLPSPAHAGLYYSGEQYAELPSRLRGFLIDHRALRAAGFERPKDIPVSPLRDDYLAAAERLEKLAKARPLTADEAADLGAVYVRLGKLEKAIGMLVPAARKTPRPLPSRGQPRHGVSAGGRSGARWRVPFRGGTSGARECEAI